MRIHPDVRNALPDNMIHPTVRYPLPLPPELARWYVYLHEDGHCIMAVPRGHWHAAAPADALVPVPVRVALHADYTVTPTRHLIMRLPMNERRTAVVFDDRDREYTERHP